MTSKEILKTVLEEVVDKGKFTIYLGTDESAALINIVYPKDRGGCTIKKKKS